MTHIARRVITVVCILPLCGPAFAQLICNDLGATRYCRDPATGTTTTTPLSGGATTIIRNPDGSRTTVNQLDGTTIIREPGGARTTINQLDGSTVIRNPDGSHSTVTPLGGGTVIRNADGSHTTVTPLGGGTVIRNPGGSTSTIVPLGGVNPPPSAGSGYGGLNSNNSMPGAGRSRCVQMGTSVNCD